MALFSGKNSKLAKGNVAFKLSIACLWHLLHVVLLSTEKILQIASLTFDLKQIELRLCCNKSVKLTETSMQSTIVLEAKRCNKIRKKSKEKLKTATTTNVKLSTLF